MTEKLMIGTLNKNQSFPKFSAVRTPYLMYDIKESDNKHRTCYALVICNHGPPTPGAGRGIAVEMSGVFTFALSPQYGGNTRDLCYIGKKGGAMKT